MRRRVLVSALAVSLLLAPALAGCSMVESAIEDATGADVSLGGLPESWPAEVPVIDGDVAFAGTDASGENPVWNATISVGSDVSADVATQLEGAGFSQTLEGGLGVEGLEGTHFTNGSYEVFVAVTGSGETWVANYSVVSSDILAPTATPAP